jgi:hypothetical protein
MAGQNEVGRSSFPKGLRKNSRVKLGSVLYKTPARAQRVDSLRVEFVYILEELTQKKLKTSS